MHVNLTTFNVLSNSLADSRFFKVSDTSVLSLDQRMPKILRELQACFERDDIICLQEVDVTLSATGLHQAFIANGYYPLTAHYSTMAGRDYFGNIITFPIKKYNLITYGQIKIGDHLLIPKLYTNPITPQPFPDGRPRIIDHDVYHEAAKRDTALLYAIFEDKLTEKRFVVHTFHMPPAFWWPAVMTLHTETLLRKIKELSNNIPHILLGDFNVIPDSPVYKLFTEGVISDPGYLPSPEWNVDTIPTLTDVRALSGFPSLPTNCARNASGAVFEGAIDHIFCSPEFSDHKMYYTPPSGEMPNNIEGSDHVPVSCTLTIN